MYRPIIVTLLLACSSCSPHDNESSVTSYEVTLDAGLEADPDAALPDPTPPPQPTRRAELTEAQLAPLRALEGQRSQAALAEVYSRFAVRAAKLEFQVHSVMTSSLGDAHVQIQQVYAGIPVDARDIHVVVLLDGQIRVYGAPDDFQNISLPPQVSHSNRAQGWAHKHGVTLGANKRILVPVFARQQLPNTSGTNAADWQTIVASFDIGMLFPVKPTEDYWGPNEIFIRDRDGAVIERGGPRNLYTPATLNGEHSPPITNIATDKSTTGLYSLRDAYSNRVRVATNGPPYANQPDNTWGDGGAFIVGGSFMSSNGETAAADALISVVASQRMYMNVFHVPPANIHPIVAQVHDQAAQSGNFAFGTGMTDMWSVTLGYVELSPLFRVGLTDVEVVGHEMGHLMMYRAGVVPSANEQRGLDEGNADIFGKNAGFYFPYAMQPSCPGPDLDSCTWSSFIDINRNWTFADYAGPGARRDFIHPTIDAWYPDIGNAEVHQMGGPMRLAYYYLTVGIAGTNDPIDVGSNISPQRRSLIVPNGFTGLGLPVASSIWWHTVIDGFYSQRTTNYLAFRDAMLGATEILYGQKNSLEYKAVQDAFAAVNVGPPADRTPPEITIDVEQTSRTVAEVTVDITDPSGIKGGLVYINHAFKNGFPEVHECTGHCVFQIDALWYGTSTHHKVRVDATDNADNFVSKTQPFTIDVSPPAITLKRLSNTAPDDPVQKWDVEITDETGISSADIKVHGTAIESRTWSPNTTLAYTFEDVLVDESAGPDGYTIVTFTASDGFGNEDTKTVTLLKDTTKPDRCELIVGPTSDSSPNELLRQLVSKDQLSGLKTLTIYEEGVGGITKISQAGPAVVDSNTLIGTFAPGKHTFYGRCEDKRGNVAFSNEVAYWIAAPCGTTNVSGANMLDVRNIDLGKPSGTVKLSYQTFGIEDRIQVTYEGHIVADTGCVATGDPPAIGQATQFTYSGNSTQVTVRVEPNCNPLHTDSGTLWNYTMSCP